MADSLVLVGRIAGHLGLRGWLKINSWCDPRAAIVDYSPWTVRTARGDVVLDVAEAGPRGKGGLAARLVGHSSREDTEGLIGADILVARERLPDAGPDRWYWADLIGLDVETTTGQHLGRIERMLETGANDVAVVKGDRERLIPFVVGVYVKSVDLSAARVVVDWDPDF